MLNFKKLLNDAAPHAIVIVVFFLVGYLYFFKTFQGYTNREEDVTQGLLKSTEITKYRELEGKTPGWTNSIFSGMPTTMIYGKENYNYVPRYSYLTPLFNGTAYPFKILFLSFIGFYLLMCAFKVKPQYGALAALAYGFATYSISSIEAAHYTKVLCMALMPAILASMHWLFRGKYFLGGVMLAFNLSLQLYYFHYQITFYSLITMVVMGIYYIIEAVKENNIKPLIISTIIAIAATSIGVATSTSKIKSTSKFAESTMRGGNDLVRAGKKGDKGDKTETGKEGLSIDYAFDFSYGIGETFTLLIPRIYGGSGAEKVSEDSEFYKATQQDTAPTYHGDLSIQSGTTYIGAIIVFLFFIGLVVVKSNIKWALLALTLISFILGWGKYFLIVNQFLFDHLPYFNKFRTPMMAFCIAQVTMPLLGFLGIKQLYDNWQMAKQNKGVKNTKDIVIDAIEPKESSNAVWQKITYVFYGVGGFCLLMALFGPSIVDMSGSTDVQLLNQGKQAGQDYTPIITALKEDRASMLRTDALRSLIFIGLVFGALWAWYTNKLNKNIAIIIIGVLAVIDLVGVDLRYLSNEEFTFEKGEALVTPKDNADNMILADKTLHYRVFDLTPQNGPFNDNSAAAYHKLIGGYDPAKLSRYQDLISEMFGNRGTDSISQAKAEITFNATLDMLNCKYLINADREGKNRMPVERNTANGNAWYIQKLTAKENAITEIEDLKNINNKVEAVFNQSFEKNKEIKTSTFTVDSITKATLTAYHPDTLKYNVSNQNAGYLVFSEIYYDDWKATIDGKPADLNKVNYTLRGLQVPAGNHKIVLYYNKIESNTDTVDLITSLTILGLMLINIVLWVLSYRKKADA